MRFRFFLSDQHGDREFSEQDLQQPFLVSPDEEHPFLTLADYFGALQQFILLNKGKQLESVVKDKIKLAEVSEAIVRSEKHGAFYHIASLELSDKKQSVKLAATTAISAPARTNLHEEYAILKDLTDISPTYLPEIFYKKSIIWKTEANTEEFVMVLGEWLSGYHEWHVGDDPASESRKVQLWDYDNGYRFLDEGDFFTILQQAAAILTCYYDQNTYRQIYPWHHGAGDFVVSTESDSISVKLITARQYEPLVFFDKPEETDRLVAAIHFLLNLVLRMRLDRLDGVFEPIWLGSFGVQAAVKGFFDTLVSLQDTGKNLIGPPADFLAIVQSFDQQEILDMYDSLLEIYREEDPDDFQLIQENLSAHTDELYDIMQSYSLDS